MPATPQPGNASIPAKRAVPISAGAFGFSFGPPVSKRRESAGRTSAGLVFSPGPGPRSIRKVDPRLAESRGDDGVERKDESLGSKGREETETSTSEGNPDGGDDEDGRISQTPASLVDLGKEAISAVSTSDTAGSSTPIRPTTSRIQTPITAISLQTPRPMRKLDALPSPFTLFQTPKVNAEAGPSKPKPTPKPIHRITDSPFLSHPAKPVGTTGAGVKVEQEGTMRRMGEVLEAGYDLGERLMVLEGGLGVMEAKKRALEEEGIGVSPRGKKGVKWTGRGPPPPSIHLANLLASHTSSLVLFYTSIQHTLFPSTKTPRRRPQFGTITPAREPVPVTPVVRTITPLSHLRTAPTHLHLVELVKNRTHHSVIFWCEVRGAASGRLKTPNAIESEEHSNTDPARVSERQDPQMVDPNTGNQTDQLEPASDSAPPPGRILVVFQPLPPECVKLGVDPRTLAARWGDEPGSWEAGVWGPYSEVEIELDSFDEGIPEAEDEMAGPMMSGEAVQDEDEASRSVPTGRVRVLFASRYLIARAE